MTSGRQGKAGGTARVANIILDSSDEDDAPLFKSAKKVIEISDSDSDDARTMSKAKAKTSAKAGPYGSGSAASSNQERDPQSDKIDGAIFRKPNPFKAGKASLSPFGWYQGPMGPTEEQDDDDAESEIKGDLDQAQTFFAQLAKNLEHKVHAETESGVRKQPDLRASLFANENDLYRRMITAVMATFDPDLNPDFDGKNKGREYALRLEKQIKSGELDAQDEADEADEADDEPVRRKVVTVLRPFKTPASGQLTAALFPTEQPQPQGWLGKRINIMWSQYNAIRLTSKGKSWKPFDLTLPAALTRYRFVILDHAKARAQTQAEPADRDGMRELFAKALDDAIEYLLSSKSKAIRYEALLKSEIAVILDDQRNQQGSGPTNEKNRQQLSILKIKRKPNKQYLQHYFVGEDFYDDFGTVMIDLDTSPPTIADEDYMGDKLIKWKLPADMAQNDPHIRAICHIAASAYIAGCGGSLKVARSSLAKKDILSFAVSFDVAAAKAKKIELGRLLHKGHPRGYHSPSRLPIVRIPHKQHNHGLYLNVKFKFGNHLDHIKSNSATPYITLGVSALNEHIASFHAYANDLLVETGFDLFATDEIHHCRFCASVLLCSEIQVVGVNLIVCDACEDVWRQACRLDDVPPDVVSGLPDSIKRSVLQRVQRDFKRFGHNSGANAQTHKRFVVETALSIMQRLSDETPRALEKAYKASLKVEPTQQVKGKDKIGSSKGAPVVASLLKPTLAGRRLVMTLPQEDVDKGDFVSAADFAKTQEKQSQGSPKAKKQKSKQAAKKAKDDSHKLKQAQLFDFLPASRSNTASGSDESLFTSMTCAENLEIVSLGHALARHVNESPYVTKLFWESMFLYHTSPAKHEFAYLRPGKRYPSTKEEFDSLEIPLLSTGNGRKMLLLSSRISQQVSIEKQKPYLTRERAKLAPDALAKIEAEQQRAATEAEARDKEGALEGAFSFIGKDAFVGTQTELAAQVARVLDEYRDDSGKHWILPRGPDGMPCPFVDSDVSKWTTERAVQICTHLVDRTISTCNRFYPIDANTSPITHLLNACIGVIEGAGDGICPLPLTDASRHPARLSMAHIVHGQPMYSGWDDPSPTSYAQDNGRANITPEPWAWNAGRSNATLDQVWLWLDYELARAAP